MADEITPSAGGSQAPAGPVPGATPDGNQAGTPPTPSGSTVSGNNVGNTPPATSGNGDDLPERTRQKYAHIESENAELKSRFNSVAGFISKSPKRYLAALKETGGMSDEEALAEVRRIHPNFQPGQQVTQQPQVNDQAQGQVPPTGGPANIQTFLTPAQQAALDKAAAQEETLNNERVKAIREFREKYPDLDNYQKQAIVSTTIMYENKGLSPAEALENARIQILEPEKFKQQGVVEGMGRAYSSMGQSSLGSGGGTNRGGGPQVTDVDEEVMKKLGFDRNPKLRERYLQKLSE